MFSNHFQRKFTAVVFIFSLLSFLFIHLFNIFLKFKIYFQVYFLIFNQLVAINLVNPLWSLKKIQKVEGLWELRRFRI